MAVICKTRVSGKDIHWEGNRGVVEHSTLFGPLREGRTFGQVFDDACDEGMVVVGKGEEVVFCVNHVEINEELLWWDLESINKKTGRFDHRFSVRVYND